jgi:hypothetical protein
MKAAIISLFDLTGAMVQPWVEAGYQCFIFDIQHPQVTVTQQIQEGANPVKVSGDYSEWGAIGHTILHNFDIKMLFSFPPCTDLAVSGAAHFEKKRQVDPEYRNKAMSMVYHGYDVAKLYDVPFMIENPVSVISSLWRKPDHIFHPYEYGGYLGADDVSPFELIPTQDRYTKKTCLWTGNGFIMPEKKPVELPTNYKYSPQHLKLGGAGLKTKNIRSATPRGFARAVKFANDSVGEPINWSVFRGR